MQIRDDLRSGGGNIPIKNPRRKPRKIILRVFFYTFLWGCLSVALFVSFLYLRLPDINELRDIKYQQPLRVLTADGALISQIGQIKRTPVAYEDIPPNLINALLSAEDARFFQHIGLDFQGLARAVLQLITDSPNQTGGSTITMQVARNYYLTRERTIMRKLNEILLAIKIERFINKEEILSLYINTIFLGFKSFGFASAAQTYYNKDLSDLTLEQYAMLAALPKAPSALNPVRNPVRARERRNWILMRMASLGYISRAQYLAAVEAELTGKPYDYATEVEGLFLAETARLQVLEDPEEYNVSKDELYTAGYRIYTSADKNMQEYANKAVRNGLLAYDKRHGWRGAEREFADITRTELYTEDNPAYVEALRELATISSYDNSLEPAIVKQVAEQSIVVVLSDGRERLIGWAGLSWAAPYINDDARGAPPQLAEEIVKVGDMIRISLDEGIFRISQIPRPEGALLAVDPNSGLIKAMVGGYHFQLTKYNRAVQARRQIGSAIKPFLYAAALERGYNGADIFNDAPFVSRSSSNLVWRPSNAGDTFLGYIPMREGLYRSRNLVSVRLMQTLGVLSTRNFMEKFAFPSKHLPNDLSLALGSAELNLPEVVRAYSVFANGGYLVKPQLILKIEDAAGETIYEADIAEIEKVEYLSRICEVCSNKNLRTKFTEEEIELLQCQQCLTTDLGDEEVLEKLSYRRIISPEVHYQIHSILKDVVARGTAVGAKDLGRNDIAGKTGTTQNFVDAWFVGYNPSLVAVSWVGFDKPSKLGPIEYGGIAALPIWKEFMRQALDGTSEKNFARPATLIEVNVTITNDRDRREFTEYVNVNHIEEYIERINKNSVYVDYDYNFLGTDYLEDSEFEFDFDNINSGQDTEQDRRDQVKELF